MSMFPVLRTVQALTQNSRQRYVEYYDIRVSEPIQLTTSQLTASSAELRRSIRATSASRTAGWDYGHCLRVGCTRGSFASWPCTRTVRSPSSDDWLSLNLCDVGASMTTILGAAAVAGDEVGGGGDAVGATVMSGIVVEMSGIATKTETALEEDQEPRVDIPIGMMTVQVATGLLRLIKVPRLQHLHLPLIQMVDRHPCL